MSKKQGCLRIGSLPHEVVELILQRLAVKSLVRFKAVSKQWESTIGDPLFQKRQLKQRQQSGDPDVLMVSVCPQDVIEPDIDSLRTLVLGSSLSVKIPTPWEGENRLYYASHGSCDGLVCLYHTHISGFVVNPSTRWYRPLPLCELQKLMIDLGDSYFDLGHSGFRLGFGKDCKSPGTYKPVCLYNSSEVGLENATTCELFDFNTNSWRLVTPASPYRVVVGCLDPVHVRGSLHWFTDCEETKVVSLDLHTEVFQVLSKTPFAHSHPFKMVMGNLDDRLCVSEMTWPKQVIWSFSSGNKTWDKMYSIDLDETSSWFSRFGYNHLCALSPLALVDGDKKTKKKKLLFYGRECSRTMVIHDPDTQSYNVAYSAKNIGYPVCYFQSLISIS